MENERILGLVADEDVVPLLIYFEFDTNWGYLQHHSKVIIKPFRFRAFEFSPTQYLEKLFNIN